MQQKPLNILYLSQADVESVNLSMGRIIEVLEDAFKRKGMGLVEMPPKPGIHPRPDAFIHAMPAYLQGENEAAGMKWISGFPENAKHGLPYITGLLILNDPQTGIPLCVMDGVWITAMRTGAATALAAKYLACKDAQSVGILGCGVQGYTNLQALCQLYDIQHVYAYDVNKKTCDRFATELSQQLNIQIDITDDPRQAVTDRDLVVTAGPILKKPHATIQAGWLSPGTFVSPVDFDSYFSPQAMREADLYCTDDVTQFAYYKSQGYFQKAPTLYGDLGEIVSGQKKGRTKKNQITFGVNLGLALDDIAVASEIYNLARDKEIGTWLAL